MVASHVHTLLDVPQWFASYIPMCAHAYGHIHQTHTDAARAINLEFSSYRVRALIPESIYPLLRTHRRVSTSYTAQDHPFLPHILK